MADIPSDHLTRDFVSPVFVARLVTALLQAIALHSLAIARHTPQGWPAHQRPTVPACLLNASTPKCVLRLITLAPQGPEAILFLDGVGLDLFEPAPNAKWTLKAHLADLAYCPKVRPAIVDGTFRMEPHPFSDLVVGDRRAVFTEPSKSCP